MVRFRNCRRGEQQRFEDVLLDLQTNNRSLTDLCVVCSRDDGLHDIDDIIQVIMELRHNVTLKYLCIEGYISLSEYNDDYFGRIHLAIAEAFKCNSSVTELELDPYWVWPRDIHIAAYFDMLSVNTTLTTLTLSLGSSEHWDESDTIVTDSISFGLKNNEALKALTLWNASDAAATIIARALQNNRAVTTLKFVGNSVGNEGVISLSEMLKCNKTLVTLCVHSESCDDEGTQAIATALQSNSTLQYLVLSDFELTSLGLDALFDSIQDWNSTITSVSLAYFPIWENFNRKLGLLLLSNKNGTHIPTKLMERNRRNILNFLYTKWIS